MLGSDLLQSEVVIQVISETETMLKVVVMWEDDATSETS